MISDDLWAVIVDYMREYYDVEATDALRDALEKHTQIKVFDGGAFIAINNEFDLFVVPAKRGRWRIRSEITQYLKDMAAVYGRMVVKISERNQPSLRLAKHFGFKEIGRENGFVRLENTSWAT